MTTLECNSCEHRDSFEAFTQAYFDAPPMPPPPFLKCPKCGSSEGATVISR